MKDLELWEREIVEKNEHIQKKTENSLSIAESILHFNKEAVIHYP